jgi:hypothetical protein
VLSFDPQVLSAMRASVGRMRREPRRSRSGNTRSEHLL